MARTPRRLLWATLAAGTWFAATAAAAKNVCSYNGKEYDDRYPPPQDFTGEYTCKDSDSGKIVLREHHVRGRQNGEYTKYDARTGQIVESGRYRDGQFDGPMRSYREGVPYQETNWVRGNLQGVQKEFNNGKLSRLYLVDDKGGRGNDIHFNDKGQPTSLECRSRPIGKQDADWCGFAGRQSTVTLYDEQGRRLETVQYLAGKQHGVRKGFKPETGILLSETRYENGKAIKDGQQEFDRDGALLVKTACDDKKTACTETQYFDGGKQVKTAIVRNGLKTAKQTDYYQNGKTERELVLDGDRFRITRYYDNGKVMRTGTYVESRLGWEPYVVDGIEETYEPDGTLESRQTYRKGLRQGAAVEFVKQDDKRYRREAEYDKDALVRERIYLGNTLVEESEYFPDGSTKSHKEYKPGAKKTGI